MRLIGRLVCVISARAYLRLIGQEQAYKAIEQLKELSADYVLPSDIAASYAGLGDKTRAFEWLESLYRTR